MPNFAPHQQRNGRQRVMSLLPRVLPLKAASGTLNQCKALARRAPLCAIVAAMALHLLAQKPFAA